MIRFPLPLVLLPLLLAPRLSSAQLASDDREADDQFRLGMEAQKAGHPDEARLHFLESYAVDQQLHTLYNLAAVEALCNRPLDALRHIREWLQSPKIDAAARARGAKIIADMFAKTGHIVAHVSPNDVISIDGNDAASLVQDNGVFDVLPGHHVVDVRSGMANHRMEVDVAMGATISVRVEGPPIPATAPSPVPPPPRSPAQESVPPLPSPPATQSAPRLRVWMTVGLGAGAVALFAGGAIFGANSSSAASNVDRLSSAIPNGSCRASASSNCADLASSVNTSNTDQTVSTVLYVTSGVAAAGAVLSWFLLPRSVHEARVEPVVGTGIVGAQWVQSF